MSGRNGSFALDGSEKHVLSGEQFIRISSPEIAGMQKYLIDAIQAANLSLTTLILFLSLDFSGSLLLPAGVR